MAVEDAAVLGNLLSRISRRSQLRHLLQAYQDLRLDRTAMAQQVSRRFRHIFHVPDGPEQRERDDNLRRTMELEVSGNSKLSPDSNQNRRVETDANDLFFRYDADAEADTWWTDHGRELEIETVASSTLQSWWRFPWEILWRLLASLYQFKPNAQV
jgi:salicylate hydroxylase